MRYYDCTIAFHRHKRVKTVEETTERRRIMLNKNEIIGLSALGSVLEKKGKNYFFILVSNEPLNLDEQAYLYRLDTVGEIILAYLIALRSLNGNSTLFQFEDQDFLQGVKYGCHLLMLPYYKIAEIMKSPNDDKCDCPSCRKMINSQ